MGDGQIDGEQAWCAHCGQPILWWASGQLWLHSAPSVADEQLWCVPFEGRYGAVPDPRVATPAVVPTCDTCDGSIEDGALLALRVCGTGRPGEQQVSERYHATCQPDLL